MFSATIANGGMLMTPYLVAAGAGARPPADESASPPVLSRAVSPQVASDMQTMMIQVMANPAGTAYDPLYMPSLEIAGKTGTAQNSSTTQPGRLGIHLLHPERLGNRTIAVGVIVKGGGFGAAAAAPIAQQVIQAYLGVP